MKKFCIFVLLSLVAFTIKAESITFPASAGVINVKDYGATGNGTTDDTQSILNAITTNWTYCGGNANNNRTLYFPNGTYKVSNTIFWMRWLRFQGQSEAGTIIKLANSCSGFTTPGSPKPVLRCRFTGLACSPSDGSENSSFANYIQNITVDTGTGNTGAIGIQYSQHNEGAIRNVTIKSGDGSKVGIIGLDLSETEFGPGLISHVTIDGFNYGVKTPGMNHATFEYLTIKNQKVAGIQNYLPLSIRKLTSINSVVAIQNLGGQLVLIDGSFTGGSAGNCAIENSSSMYLRNITSSGYQAALKDNNVVIAGSSIAERATGSHIETVWTSPNEHLKLTIEDPSPVFDEASANWVLVSGSGDITTALQSAIDGGAQTIYLNFNVKNYTIYNTIYIRGNVKRIVGMGAGIQADPNSFSSGTKPMFVFQNTSAITVEHLSIQQYATPVYTAVQIDTNKPVFFKSFKMSVASGTYGIITNTANASGGKLFLEDVHEQMNLSTHMNVWMRHYNPENNPAGQHTDRIFVQNNGGKAWILGMKTEGVATNVKTTGGGKSEILGGFFRDHENSSSIPYFNTVESSVSASYMAYSYDCCHNRALHATETRGGVQRSYSPGQGTYGVTLYSGFVATETGKVRMEKWTNVAGTTVAEIPVNTIPNSIADLTSIEIPSNTGVNNYGVRIRGYIIPSTTGSYNLYIASDDKGELWLSTNDQPANKSMIAYVGDWANPRDWTANASQKSAAKSLTANTKYYFEALVKQGAGGDNLSVAWSGPGISGITLIGSANISSYSTIQQVKNNPTAINVPSPDAIEIYPNPATGILNVTLPTNLKLDVRMFNLNGQMVIFKHNQSGLTTLDVENLNAGLYLIQIDGANYTKTFKAILK